jgi:tetratricopeptide (TPR) repeat protein
MKAEHRHELKTNALADMMNRAMQAIKAGPSRHGMWLVGLVIVVAAAAFGGYLWWQDRKEARSALWVQVDDAERKLEYAVDRSEVEKTLKDFETLAKDNPGTPQARAVRFDRARTLLRQGLEHLYSPEREAAIQQIKDARKIYENLAADKDNDALLTQEALMSVAKADESLGDLDKAVEGYKKLAGVRPKTPLVEAAEKRSDYLSNPDNRKKVQELYDKLEKETGRTSSTPGDGGDKK